MAFVKVRGLKKLQKKLQAYPKQAAFAMSLALNETAKNIQHAQKAELKKVFKNPTRWTVNGFRIRYAKRNRLLAKVFFKNEYQSGGNSNAEEYLMPHIKGGGRKLKNSERLFQRAGVLPMGMYMVPGKGVETNAHGNVKAGTINKMLSYFKAFPEAGYRANITDEKRARQAKGTKKKYGVAYFVGRPGGAPLGIWRRINAGFGTEIRPMFIFVRTPKYRKRYNFDGVTERTFDRRFNLNFKRSMVKTLRTMRK